MGEPKIPIDWERVDQLLVAGCKGTEVAAFLGIHEDTLYNRCKDKFGMLFSAYSAQKRQKGDSLLRHSQFKNAISGNTTMQVWLGKQRLKQKENPQSDDDFNGSLAQVLDLLKKQALDHEKKKEIEETKVKQLEGKKDDGIQSRKCT